MLAAPDDSAGLREAWGFSGERLVVGYSGNLGRAHELDTMLGAARVLAQADAAVDFLFIGDEDGEVARLIRRHDCGWTFAPGDGEAIAVLLGELGANREPLANRGRNARRMVRDHYSRSHGIAAWDALLRNVAAD